MRSFQHHDYRLSRTRPKAHHLIKFLIGCGLLSGLQNTSAGQFDPAKAHSLYQRAETQFVEADLFKPKESDTEDLPFKLAPLFLQEVGSNAPVRQIHFGALTVTNDTVSLIDIPRTVYFDVDSVTLNGRAHTRLSYLWFSRNSLPRGSRFAVQGLRLTLNSNLSAVITEVLHDPSGMQLLFASHSIEAAAKTQFGPALVHRRYSLEQSTAKMPRVVVARIIEDGPMPMGPIVYLPAEEQSVATLICRCMPAQARQVRTNEVYELVPWTTVAGLAQTWRKANPKFVPAFWPQDTTTSIRLQKALRLPLF